MPKNYGKLAIRLAFPGCVNRPFYHVVVIKKHMGRDKPPIEQLGTYDPMPNIHNEKLVALNLDRLQHYIMRRADITKPVEKLLGKCSKMCRGSFALTDTDSGTDSDSDSKPNGYIVLCRTCSGCIDSDSDRYSLFLYRTGIRVRVHLRQCK